MSLVDGDVEVIAADGTFRVRNHSERLSLVVAIIELETSALIDLAPCDSWENPIAPGGEWQVRYVDVGGYSPAAEMAIVYWCFLDAEQVVYGGSLQVPFD